MGLPNGAFWSSQGAAFAQSDDDGDDDDDGSDDDDDDGGSASAGGGGSEARDTPRDSDRQVRGQSQRRNQSTQRRAEVAAPPPAFAANEIVVTNLSDPDLLALQAEGFDVIERITLTNVAVTLHRLRAPATLTLEQARERVRAQPSGATGDFNHFYRSEQDSTAPAPEQVQPVAMPPVPACSHLNCAALELINWPAARDLLPDCKVTVPIGVIDTEVNAAHENLVGAKLEVLRLLAEEVDPSKAIHGTAVASMLVGQGSDRAPGLIPEANLVVVDVFGRVGGDERASVASLISALDLLAQRQVKVMNLSLAGPPNVALETVLARLSEPGGAVVLAAAGNAGPRAETAYPAGYATVLAVTAVDQRGQIYRRAQRGPHLDIAAPGVEIWSATSIKGVKPKTGTSFAVPFATAVAAILASRNPGATPADLAEQVRQLVRDIGAEGSDEIYGSGLLSLETLCAPQNSGASTE